MNEEYFVKTYIRKVKQERLLHELSHKEKRYRALSRFCHNAETLLNAEKIALQGNNLLFSDSFNRFIQGQKEPCLILSPDAAADGQILPAMEAVQLADLTQDACIVFNSRFAYVQSEPLKSGTQRYLLLADTKDVHSDPLIY